jgi:general stress protein 26
VSTDPEEKRELWVDEYRRYFKGPDDASYVVIRVVPDLIEHTGPDSPKPRVWRRAEEGRDSAPGPAQPTQ